MMGAHTDSVQKGPGIEDDGTGTIGILTAALALTGFEVTNAVRMGFWTGEEFGLRGSTYYVTELNNTASELAKIRAYLNYDMIGSPNYAYFIYDGDGSAFNESGPPGSDVIEHDYEAFFAAAGLNSSATEFDGRSDYGPFLDVNIPSGGLFTGAEDPKTAEEVEMYGGTADLAYDENYHGAGDNINNIAWDAFLVNTKAIANSLALYATDLSRIPVVGSAAPSKRSWMPRGGPRPISEQAERSLQHRSGDAHFTRE
jgi:Zn-dependent M28 family amino/carboxypeptidase